MSTGLTTSIQILDAQSLEIASLLEAMREAIAAKDNDQAREIDDQLRKLPLYQQYLIESKTD